MRVPALVGFVTLTVSMAAVAPLQAQPVRTERDASAHPAAMDVLGTRTFGAADLACADLPGHDRTPSGLRITAAHLPEHRSTFGKGDEVVLDGGSGAGFVVGQRYFIRRIQAARSSAGLLSAALPSVRTAGWLTVTAVDTHVALAIIDYSCDVTMAGDYLDPYVEPTLPTGASAGAPQFDRPATVLSGADRREVFGAGDVVSIQLTSGETLVPGAAIGFYRNRGASRLSDNAAVATTPLPLVSIGSGVVLSVAGDHAQVVVKTSRDAVRRGDVAVPQ